MKKADYTSHRNMIESIQPQSKNKLKNIHSLSALTGTS